MSDRPQFRDKMVTNCPTYRFAVPMSALGSKVPYLVAQFYVRHIGLYEVWSRFPDHPAVCDLDAYCRVVVQQARDFYEGKWTGVSRDMVVTGVVKWQEDTFSDLFNVADLPKPMNVGAGAGAG